MTRDPDLQTVLFPVRDGVLAAIKLRSQGNSTCHLMQ
jgi:hypothetical protein